MLSVSGLRPLVLMKIFNHLARSYVYHGIASAIVLTSQFCTDDAGNLSNTSCMAIRATLSFAGYQEFSIRDTQRLMTIARKIKV